MSNEEKVLLECLEMYIDDTLRFVPNIDIFNKLLESLRLYEVLRGESYRAIMLSPSYIITYDDGSTDKVYQHLLVRRMRYDFYDTPFVERVLVGNLRKGDTVIGHNIYQEFQKKVVNIEIKTGARFSIRHNYRKSLKGREEKIFYYSYFVGL